MVHFVRVLLFWSGLPTAAVDSRIDYCTDGTVFAIDVRFSCGHVDVGRAYKSMYTLFGWTKQRHHAHVVKLIPIQLLLSVQQRDVMVKHA